MDGRCRSGRKKAQACLRPRDRFWDIPVPKIDSAFDNLFVPQPSWSPSTTQQLRKLVAAPYLAPNDWTPRSEAYFVFPLAQGTPGKQCGLAATGVYQPSLRSPWLAAEEHCPRLLDDIVDILDTTGQTDPTFRSTRIYTPITAREVRRRLLEQKGYTDSPLIGERSLRTKLNMLGYRPQRIRKCKPHKRLPETDAIFEEIHRVNAQSDEQPGVLR
ncbi:ISAzo13-like element transposase-related protein, partial [Thiolapillus sp.]|uniref:ISAzo13-like element transposase-related protein n=1 Tax=Thiolapillus sp. TaxID=2017437 RepID=UPI003AF9B71A